MRILKITLYSLVFATMLIFTSCCTLFMPANECPPLSISVSGGITDLGQNSNYNETDIKNNNLISNGNESILGYGIGIFTEIPLKSQFSIETGLNIAGKGNKNTTGSGNSKFEDKLRMIYIDVPVISRYKFSENKGFSVYGGLQPSLLLNAKRKTTLNGDTEDNKVTDQFKKVDFAVVAGLGYELNNGLKFNLGYDLGLSNINKEDFGFSTKNRFLKFSVAYQLGK